MTRTIIAGVSESAREQMSRLLTSSGYSVYRCCASGSSLRRALMESEDSILIFIGLLPDCKPDDLIWDYGDKIQILWIAKPAVLEDCESKEIFRLPLPITGQTVVGALEMLIQLHRRRMPRSAISSCSIWRTVHASWATRIMRPMNFCASIMRYRLCA